MRRFLISLLVSGAVAAALATGCNSPSMQFEARAQAQKRWNEARSQVKAQLAAEQLAAGNVADASNEVSKALALSPDNPGLMVLRARTALAEGDTGTALRLLERIPADDAHRAEVAYLLGVIWQQRLKWEPALECFARAAEAEPSESAYFIAVVQTLLQLGKPTESLEYLRGNEDRFGWTPAWHAALAECQEQLGRWDEAASAWRQVADSSGDPSVIERFATALHHAGRCREALPLLRSRLANADEPASQAVSQMLAECLLEDGQLDAARAQLINLLEDNPRDCDVLLLLSRVHVEQRRYDLALRTVRRAIDAQPERFEPLELASAVAYRLGQRAQAAAFARRAESLQPQHDSFVIRAILDPLRSATGKAVAAESSSMPGPNPTPPSHE